MKKIGFIDYYLSEWHANNYPAWIKAASARLGYEFEVAYAWGEKEVSPVDGVTSREWADKFGVELCSSIEELCEKSDYILILAPSDPETHLRLCRAAFACGKPAYVDKTFAPDFATAKEIFSIADEHGVKFFSSSALRYADELKGKKARFVSTTGGGSNLEEYIVHQAEMVVKTIGVGATRLRVERSGQAYQVRVEYGDERRANMQFAPCLGFAALLEEENGSIERYSVSSDFFKNLIEDVLRFYEEQTVSFDGAETLEVMKLREGVIKAKEQEGQWVEF